MPANKPILVVIAGPNGSGKTTLTRKLLQHEWTESATYINADEIARDRFGDWNSPDAVRQAANYADERRAQFMKEGRSFAYETVFSTARRLEDLSRAKELGFFIRLFFVGTEDPRINIDRVERRFAAGGHTVPEDKIVARYSRSIGNLLPALRLVDRGYVFDNSTDDAFPTQVFRTQDGVIRKVYADPLPNWAWDAYSALRQSPTIGPGPDR